MANPSQIGTAAISAISLHLLFVIGQSTSFISFNGEGGAYLITVLDLFCGAGGFSYGFQKEGFHVVLGVDNEQHKLNTYMANMIRSRNLKFDIAQLTANKILSTINMDNIDVIIGSPPCKDFSKSNQGLIEFLAPGRAGLPYHFFRLVTVLRPKVFVMENVEGYFKTTNGEFMKHLFTPFGYNVSLYTLNAADFGVPQNRIRSFLIGSLKPFQLQIPKASQSKLNINDAISDLEDVATTGEASLLEPKTSYQKQMRNTHNTVTNHYGTRHCEAVINRLSRIKCGQNIKDLPDSERTRSKFSGAYYRPYYDATARTITTRFDTPTGDGESVHPTLNRCFTPREAARLQSFDDSYNFSGAREEIKLQIGDAVPPLLAQAIAKQIMLLIQ